MFFYLVMLNKHDLFDVAAFSGRLLKNPASYLYLWAVFFMAVHLSITFYGDTVSVRCISPRQGWYALAASFVIFLGVFSCFSLFFTTNADVIMSQNYAQGNFFPFAMTVVICLFALPLLCCENIRFPVSSRSTTTNTPSAAVIQACFLMLVYMAIGGVLMAIIGTLAFRSILGEESKGIIHSLLDGDIFAVTVIEIWFMLFCAPTFCMGENVKYLDKQIKNFAKNRRKYDSLYALSILLRRQNLLALGMFLPYMIVPAIFKYIADVWLSKKSWSVVWEEKTQKYIPRIFQYAADQRIPKE
jgi:hypothetical protein